MYDGAGSRGLVALPLVICIGRRERISAKNNGRGISKPPGHELWIKPTVQPAFSFLCGRPQNLESSSFDNGDGSTTCSQLFLHIRCIRQSADSTRKGMAY